MKKILLIILVLVSVQSFGQLKKKYAEKLNTDGSIDSFYVRTPIHRDSVFNYADDQFVIFTLEYYLRHNLALPTAFSNFTLYADGVFKNTLPQPNYGTYTPTLTNVTNVAASTAFTSAWVRVGNLVTVTGQVSIDCTAAASTATEIGISLPVASNLVADASLAGTAVSDQVASLSGRIKADATNDRARIVFKAVSATNDTYSFTFTYLVQ